MHTKYFCQAICFKTPSFQLLFLFMRRRTVQTAVPAMAQLNTAVTAMSAMEDCFCSLAGDAEEAGKAEEAGDAEEEQKAVWEPEGETAGLALDLNVLSGRGVRGVRSGEGEGSGVASGVFSSVGEAEDWIITLRKRCSNSR